MDDNKIIDELLVLLQEKSISNCQYLGGYPDDIQVVGEHICIATLDHKPAPSLEVYPIKEALTSYKESKEEAMAACIEEDGDSDDWKLFLDDEYFCFNSKR